MRLEQLDSYLTVFEAEVLEVVKSAGGNLVRLDRSAFYPASGGQPHDTGTLAGAPVTDVTISAGAVWHTVVGASPAVGDTVVGAIDWPRRFAHMQRHSAQHLLSQAFMRVGAALGAAEDGVPGFHTCAVSLRGEDCTLDLTGEPDEAACQAAGDEANDVARRALGVLCFEVPDELLGLYQLRRPPKVSGLVRLVAMGAYDVAACGGTHVRDTAQLLPVAVMGRERVRGGLTRVTFRAGGEALADLTAKRATAARLARLLSAPAAELPARVTALQDRVADLERSLAAARSRLADSLADALLARAEPLPGGARLVAHLSGPADAELWDAVIARLQQEPGCLCALVDDSGAVLRVACLAGPGADVDVRQALADALALVGGRGGGRPDRAQGSGGGPADASTVLAAAASALRAAAGARPA